MPDFDDPELLPRKLYESQGRSDEYRVTVKARELTDVTPSMAQYAALAPEIAESLG